MNELNLSTSTLDTLCENAVLHWSDNATDSNIACVPVRDIYVTPPLPTEAEFAYTLTVGRRTDKFTIKKIIFNDPATVIFWDDGTKTVVKATEGDVFDPYYGFCCAVTKRVFGNMSKVKKLIKRSSTTITDNKKEKKNEDH